MIKYICIIGLTTGMLILSGCSGFLDINVDPNNPTDSPVNLLLPSAEVSLGGYFGMASTGLSHIPTLYMHQYVERGVDKNDYGVQGTNFEIEVPWAGLYSATLSDLSQIITKGKDDGNLVYAGIAQILQAYTYSLMVDIWGDIPYSEAIKGTAVIFPKFDNGKDVYTGLYALIDEGITNVSSGTGLEPGADDLFYNGDAEKWVRFANTLKLKMYAQTRLVEDVRDEVLGLINQDNLIGPGDDFELPYGTNQSPDDRNPGFTFEYGGNSTYISPFFYEMMKGTSDDNTLTNGIADPRIPYYFFNQLTNGAAAQNPTAYRDGDFVSIWMFSFNIDPNEGFDQAQSKTVAGLYPLGGKYDDGKGGAVGINSALGNTPQRLLTWFAHLYLRAELALTGVTNEDHRSLFESAMRASFDKVDEVAAQAGAPALSQAAVDVYISEVLTRYDAADNEGKLEWIMTEKWVASFGFAIDSYTDYRRTGYPKLFDGNLDTNPNTRRGREFPVSLPYSTSNLQLNPNAPAQRTITRDKIFWDN
ncbi:MAG: SusD/RagB family nutrient-binding outer membrane lipoprotein [Bacteroidia bacterium]|nr:SusD/RagB family nutrient-binding outer membrane lipoprotein [Bacteroidia bacterium]